MDEKDILVCSCCGGLLKNTNMDNVDFDVYPYHHDNGYGLCRRCGGYPDNKKKSTKKRLGWAGQMFYEARFPIVRNNLCPDNQVRWDNMSYEQKIKVVYNFVIKGLII